MPQLVTPYFRLVTSEIDGGAKVKHEVYACARPTLVLFDTKTQEPLASFMFQAHGEDLSYRGHARPEATKLATTVVYPRENDVDGRQRFQGIVDQDKQFAEYVLTNLGDEGTLNVNILKENRSVREVNPRGLNQINEIRPCESIKIYSDQTMRNAKMILEGVVRAVHNAATGEVKMEDVSVGQDQDEVRDKKKQASEGTHYYLSVVPELGIAKLRERFESTRWRVVDMFRLTHAYVKPEPQPMYRGLDFFAGGRGGVRLESAEVGGGNRYVVPAMRGGGGGNHQLQQMAMFGMAPAAPAAGGARYFRNNVVRESNSRGGDRDGSRGGGGGGYANEMMLCSMPAAAAASSSNSRRQTKSAVSKREKPGAAARVVQAFGFETNNNDDDDDGAEEDEEEAVPECAFFEAAGAATQQKAKMPTDYEALVRASQAAKVRGNTPLSRRFPLFTPHLSASLKRAPTDIQ
jgi:hypothetical protein